LPNPKHVPLVANAVLTVVLLGCLALLLGAPVENVLSIADNPLSRVVVVTFAITLVGVGALAFSVHLLLHRHSRMEDELAEMRELVDAAHARTSALAATSDELEGRVDEALDRVEDAMRSERARMRDQVRTYLAQGEVPEDEEESAEADVAGGTNGEAADEAADEARSREVDR